ncbi:MAG: hypothetical protein LV480_06830 [Methylacidiphilales bacterium]|nr:hypothetical protein [Candidatus Methylacidiphilales bacterium]
MKKSSHPSRSKKKAAPNSKGAVPLDDPLAADSPSDETNLTDDQFTVAGREDEATSSGHRVEPIEVGDEEHNAETLIEEGLHGYLRASPNKTRRGR